MIELIFESHATTFDNEQKRASGHNDVALSEAGEAQAKQMGVRRKGEHFDAIFTSDLQRAYNTARLAFGQTFPIIQDARLRECDYGEFENRPKDEVDAARINYITKPFPGGESYEQRAAYMKSFLQEILSKYDGKRIMVIGHRATHFGLDHSILGRPLEELAVAHWEWQPGWTYHLDTLHD